MPVTAWRAATTSSQAACSTPHEQPDRPWNNIDQVFVQDGVYADADHSVNDLDIAGDVTNCLAAKTFGFTGLGLPASDVVLGIELRAFIMHTKNNSNVTVSDFSIRAVLGGIEVGENLSRQFTFWPTSFQVANWGDINKDYDWGGAPPTVGSLVDSSFGWALASKAVPGLKLIGTATAESRVDIMEMRIRHEPPQPRRRSTLVYV